MKKIEVFRTERGYTVIVGDMFDDSLCRDEALGVVAAAIYGAGRPPYIKTYEEWHEYQKRFPGIEVRKPVALLTAESSESKYAQVDKIMPSLLGVHPFDEYNADVLKTLITIGRGIFWSAEFHEKIKALEREISEEFETILNMSG